jgi:serine/threonine-protein kinase
VANDDVTVGPSLSETRLPETPRTPGGSAPAKLAPGSIIAGRYRLVALLGKGGMGEVYRADDLTLDHPVALKFLPATTAPAAARGRGDNAEQLALFHNELRTARQVSHKNVCRLYDLGEAGDRRFLTMEYVDGEDLASLLRRIGRLPHDKAIDIARQLCAGLAAAHERGVVHRDLKPANVMIDGDGNVRITDFGLAVAAGDADAVRAGTPHYMAPEQLAGQPATIQSDIYALGLILFEIFTGKRAHDAKTFADLVKLHESGAITTPSSVVRDLDPMVERVIMRCLDKDPAKRPASALAVAAALPGANPLADALAAGETPSPELLAAAGEEQALPVARALGLFAAIAVGLAAYVGFAAHASLVGRVPLEKPAAVLIDRADAIARSFGYTDVPADKASGTAIAGDYLDWLVARDQTPQRWDALSRGTPPALLLWYRTSPRPMTPLLPFEVRPNDPPLNDSAMRIVVVDTGGRLQEFHAVPPQVDADTGPVPPTDWSPAFSAAGLDMRAFTATAPRWTPHDFGDSRNAWFGPLPDGGSGTPVTIRVEAASYRGRPVSFTIVAPWSRATRMEPRRPSRVDGIINLIAVVILCALFIGAMILARMHLRENRADRRGAARLMAYVLLAGFVDWVVSAHHVSDVSIEFGSLYRTAGPELTIAAIIGVMYVALEPYVRRFWPDSLLGWSRLLSGYMKDPRVGRDLLTGIAMGIAIASVDVAKARLLPLAGFAAPTPIFGSEPDVIMRPLGVISGWIELSFRALEASLLIVLMFVVVRMLTRRAWIGAAVMFVVLSLIHTNNMTSSNTNWIWLFPLLSGALMTVTVLRFGLLSLAAASFVANVITRIPMTLDIGEWYAAPSNWTLVALAVLTAFAFSASRAGQPVFGRLDAK